MHYTEPLIGVLCIIAVFGFIALRRRNDARLAKFGVAGLFLITWPPVQWLVSRPLEIWYPVRALPSASAEAIVVLGSTVRPPLIERPYPSPDDQTYHRIEFAAWLYRRWKQLPVLACGGPEMHRQIPISETMRTLLRGAGVPNEEILTEERSQTTHENALFGSEILRQHGITSIALVVDASSMLRAEACFRKAGITVVPAPSQFTEFGPLSGELLPSWKAIRGNETTLHETVGLAWYWFHDWI